MMSAHQVRDYLLPSLWATQKELERPLKRNVDLQVVDGNLYLSIDGQRQLFFSKAAIADGSWRDRAKQMFIDKMKLGDDDNA